MGFSYLGEFKKTRRDRLELAFGVTVTRNQPAECLSSLEARHRLTGLNMGSSSPGRGTIRKKTANNLPLSMPPKLQSSSDGAFKIEAYDATLKGQPPLRHFLRTSQSKFEMSQKQGTFEAVAPPGRGQEPRGFRYSKTSPICMESAAIA